MKISTKGRYGLRAMIDLAIHSNGTHVPLFNIAERQGISAIYLEQVFSTLRKAGLVKSVKGAQGGYLLADVPEKMSVGVILRALEGDLSVVDEQDIKSSESLVSECIKVEVWDKIDESISELVDNISLQDLLKEHRLLNEKKNPMYYI